MFFTELSTGRLTLENITPAHRGLLFSLYTNPVVNQYLFNADPLTGVEGADEIIELYTLPEPRNQHRWALTLKDTGEAIGTCGFHNWNRAESYVEMGYELLPQYQGMGYMGEALGAITTFAKVHMDVEFIDAHIYVDNIKSIKALVKLGFVNSGDSVIYINQRTGKEYFHYVYELACR